jgi:hypothetical protein
MSIFYSLIGRKFPLNPWVAVICLALGILSIPFVLFGTIFFGVSLLFIPVTVILIFIGLGSLVSYLFKAPLGEIDEKEETIRGRRISIVTWLTIIITGITLGSFANKTKIERTETFCLGDIPLSFISTGSVNNNLALSRKILITKNSSCMNDFWGETEDKALNISTEYDRHGRIHKFEIHLNMKYDRDTVLRHLNSIRNTISDIELSKAIDKVLDIKFKGFFMKNIKVNGTLISLDGGLLKINNGKFNTYDTDATKHCLSVALRTSEDLVEVSDNIRSIGVNGGEFKIYPKKSNGVKELVARVIKKKLRDIDKRCHDFITVDTVGVYVDETKVMGIRKDGSIWERWSN